MILPYRDKQPLIEESAYVSSSATVVGDVTLEKRSSVWFHNVMHGGKGHIHIGRGSNIQDNCTLHTDPKHLLQIGKRVAVDHNTMLHDCMIEDEVLIDMRAIVLNGAHIGRHGIVGAGVLVRKGQQIPENSLAMGGPARIIRKCSEEQIKEILGDAAYYTRPGSGYKEIDI